VIFVIELIHNEVEDTDMCIAVQSSYEKAKSEGRVEGRAEGEIKMCIKLGKNVSEIAELTGLSEKEIQDIIDNNDMKK
jgi:predicted transposase/invertase (TIGR01784 family)